MDKEDIRWLQRLSNYRRGLAQLTKFIDKGELNELEQQGLLTSSPDEPGDSYGACGHLQVASAGSCFNETAQGRMCLVFATLSHSGELYGFEPTPCAPRTHILSTGFNFRVSRGIERVDDHARRKFKSKDGVAVRAILPRSKGRGLPRKSDQGLRVYS